MTEVEKKYKTNDTKIHQSKLNQQALYRQY